MRVLCIKSMEKEKENEHPFVKGVEYDIDEPTARRLEKEGYLRILSISTLPVELAAAIKKEK